MKMQKVRDKNTGEIFYVSSWDWENAQLEGGSLDTYKTTKKKISFFDLEEYNY